MADEDEEDDITNHRCCWCRAGRHQNYRRVEGSWREWWGRETWMKDKTPALLPLPFFLKTLIWCNCNCQLTCLLRLVLHSWHTHNPFLFWAPENSSVLRQHSGVIRAAVALLSQPSGTPAALHQWEWATVANLSLIGWSWLKGFSCVSGESSRRKARYHVRWRLVVL